MKTTTQTSPVHPYSQCHWTTRRLLMLPPIAAALTLQAAQYGDFEYALSGGEIAITGYAGSNSDVSIPETIDGYPVTRIGEDAFRGRTELTSVTIPDGVTFVGNETFSGCSNLKRVYFEGAAPQFGGDSCANCLAVVCYRTATSGWGPEVAGRPTAL